MKVKSLDDFPEKFYIKRLTSGKGGVREVSDERNNPHNLEMLEKIRSDSCDGKFYNDDKLHIELELDFEEPTQQFNLLYSTSSILDIKGCLEYFLKNPATAVHYINVHDIKRLYDDAFGEAIVHKLLLELKDESQKNLDAGIVNVAKILFNNNEIKRWVAEFTIPQINDEQKVTKYIEYALNTNRVALGLEILDAAFFDWVSLGEFNSTIESIKKALKFTLVETEVEQARIPVNQKASAGIIDRLKNTRGLVLIKANFSVTKIGSKAFSFEFRHPVSDYWGKDVKIVMHEVHEEGFISNYASLYSRHDGRPKLMHVLGVVFEPLCDREPYDFTVIPYAIF